MRTEIGNGLWSSIKTDLNNNFIDLYNSKFDIVSIPSDLTTPLEIQNFISSNQGETIAFPRGAVYNWNRPVILDNVQETHLITNGARFKMISNPPTFSYSVGSFSDSAPTLFVIGNNSKNVTIDDMILDGNSLNVAAGLTVEGIKGVVVVDSENITFNNLRCEHVNFHAIDIENTVKNIRFPNITFYNNYGADNASDVFLAPTDDSDVHFGTVYTSRDTFIGDQTFYTNSGIVTIDTVIARNITAVLDIRHASVNCTNIIGYNCGMLVKLIDNDTTGLPSLNLVNLIGRLTQGGDYGTNNEDSAFAVYDGDSVNVVNVDIEYDPTGDGAFDGLLVRGNQSAGVINNLSIGNLRLKGQRRHTIYLNNAPNVNVSIRDLLSEQTQGSSAIQVDASSGAILNLENYNYIGTVSNTVNTTATIISKALGVDVDRRQNAGTPVSVLTPVFLGEEVFDSTNSKWYKSTGLTNTNWVALN